MATEQRTLNIGNTVIYCYSDGSIEMLEKHNTYSRLKRTFGSDDGNGYRRVRIKGRNFKVHRLIGMAFCENKQGLSEIDHIDRNRSNNVPSNLRWVSRKENCDNTDIVIKSIATYGVRHCDDKVLYEKRRRKAKGVYYK